MLESKYRNSICHEACNSLVAAAKPVASHGHKIIVTKVPTYIRPLVSLPTVEDSSCELDALVDKVLADLVAIQLVDLGINHGKAAVVALGMDPGGIQKLRIGRIQQRSVRDHVDIVRDGEGEDVAPTPASSHRLGGGDDGRRRLLLHGHLLLGGGLFEFEDILRSPFQGTEGDLGAGHFTFLLPFAEVNGSGVAAASSLAGRCAAGSAADGAVRGTARGGQRHRPAGNLGGYQSGADGFWEGRPCVQDRRRKAGPGGHVGLGIDTRGLGAQFPLAGYLISVGSLRMANGEGGE